MKLQKSLLLLPTVIALATPASAVQINWGNQVDSDLRDSFGNPLDGTFAIQLGFFDKVLDEQFVPTAVNAADWSSHWKVFDQAAFNPSSGYFSSSALLRADGSSSSLFADTDEGLDFSNQDAYIWIHNTETLGTNTEWFLARSSTTSVWHIPDKVADCCDHRAPLEWSFSDLQSGTTPVFGKQGIIPGSGVYTTTGTHTLQTFTFVPEPSSSLLLALGGVAVVFRRRRMGI